MSAALTQTPSELSQLSDTLLVELSVSGSMAAFAELHRRLSPIVYRRLARLLGGSSEVDDVVQEVFLQLHLSMPRYDATRPLVNWLQRITRNVAFSHLRKRPSALDPLGIEMIGAGPDEWRRLSSRDKLRALDAVLQQLSPDARDNFIMFAIEGMTLAEIADQTGEPLNTIAARVRRARERMMLALRQRDADLDSSELEP